MDTTLTTIPPAAVEALRRTVAGLIVYPTDPTYGALIATVGGLHRPAVVIVPATEGAVGAAVDVARVHGLTLGVTGAETALVVTHDLDDVAIDSLAGTATVGVGVTWPAFRSALAGTGLQAGPTVATHATVLASVASGDLEPVSTRVVLADGFVHVVAHPQAPADHPETGLRVVTAVEIPLHPSTHQIEEHHR